jgi:ATP-dependent DNA helicase RecG
MFASDSAITHVEELLAKGRGAEIQWYAEDVLPITLAETLVAMANSAGGEVLIGISPRAGHVIGVNDSAVVMDKVFQAVLHTDPSLVLPMPKSVKIRGQCVVWVVVPRGLPHAYSLNGRYLGRDHSQNAPLAPRKLRALMVERGVLPFETRIPDSAVISDLDPEQIQAYINTLGYPSDTSPEELLFQRGCLKLIDGEYVPTYAGLLLFGKHPQRWLPSASILAVRFAGETFSDRFVKKDMAGSLPVQLRQAISFLLENINRSVVIEGMEHSETLEYPFEAVREILVNAVAHRDYNLQGDNIHINLFTNRLEVHSPGVLPGPVNLDNLLEARFSRNPVLMQVLSDLGFGERIGYGLDRVVRTLSEKGMPQPVFEEIGGSFRVALRKGTAPLRMESLLASYKRFLLNPRQEAAIIYISQNHRVTNREFQDLCPDVHPETLRRDLADLAHKGIIMKIGDKRATYYVLKRESIQA